MQRPGILIFGGHPDHLHQVTHLLGGIYTVSTFPLLHRLSERELNPMPHLALVFQKSPSHKAINCLKHLRETVPRTVILFIAENPTGEDIIEAFRYGINDYILFPYDPNEFLEIVERNIKKRKFNFSNFNLGNPGNMLRRWFEKKNSGKHIISAFQTKNTLGFLPQHPLSNSILDKQTTNNIEVQLFESFTVSIRGLVLDKLPGEKYNALWAYLLYYHKKKIHRETILSQFWGYTSPSSARKSLNVAIHTIRRHLQEKLSGEEVILYQDDHYFINPDLDLSTDADEFLDNWRRGRFLDHEKGLNQSFSYYQKAALLYQGDFLEDIHYEEWCESERDNLKETYLFMCDRIAAYFFNKGHFEYTIEVLQKMQDKDNCMEDVHRKMILCFYQLGQRDRAIKQYYKCTQILKEELKIAPSYNTRELFRQINEEKEITISLF